MATRKSAQQVDDDVIGEIRTVFRTGSIDRIPGPDEWFFSEMCEPLRDKLCGIKGAAILYERTPERESQGSDGSDPDEDPADCLGPARSYHLFFIGPTGERFEFAVEQQAPDEHGTMRTIAGIGRVGCCVAVSMVAGYAMIKLDDMSRLEDGCETIPDIGPSCFALDGRPIEPEEHLAELFGPPEMRELEALQKKIVAVLDGFGLPVLTREQAQVVVPDLKMGEGFCPLGPGDEVTVFDALFFTEP